MKHLEKFNWFRKKTEISDDVIKDIYIELKDLGFGDISMHKWSTSIGTERSKRYHGYICGMNFNGIPWKDIKDTILRIKDYLGINYKKFEYTTRYNPSGLIPNCFQSKLNEKTDIKDDIYKFMITYDIPKKLNESI